MINLYITNYLQKLYWHMCNSKKFHISNLNVHNYSKTKYPNVYEHFAQRHKKFSVRHCLYAIGLIQIGLIHYMVIVPQHVTVINLVLFSAVYFISIPLIRQLKTPGLFFHSWATWIIGGIGMLLGHTLDSYLSSATDHAHHHGAITTSVSTTEIYSFLFSGMTSLMLIFCIPACVYLCNIKLANQSDLRKWILHLSSGLSMLLGMFIAIQTEQYILANINYMGSASYYFMLILMVMFSSSTYYLVFKTINRVRNTSII